MSTATATPRSPYGRWGRPLRVFGAFQAWAADPRVQEALQEAESRADFAEFLMGMIRQSVLRGYDSAAPQWDRYMGVETAQDFREHRLRGLGSMSGIHHVGELGEYKELRRARRPVASYAVDTYGGVYSVSRHLIINDNLREITGDVPEQMGAAMGRFVTRTGIALIESNPNAPDGSPVYSTSRGNEVTTPLSEDSIVDLYNWMENQLDDSGDEITLTPSVIAVKNLRQQLIAKRIVRSQETGTTINYTGGTHSVGTTRFDKGTANPLFGMFDQNAVIRDPYFSDPEDYYLFADPGTAPAFIMAFLNGNRRPFVGMKNPEVRGALPGVGDDPYTYEMDSLDFKVRHDFGAAVRDHRATARGKVA
jgi:hypothetical protein